MKLFTKIKAFFNFRGKQQEIEATEVEATEVEVRQDTIYIHPTEDESKVLAIKSGMVDIFVDPEKELSDDDVQIFDKEELKKKREKKDKAEDDKKQNPDKKRHTRNYIPRRGDWYPNEYIRRKITFSVYQDEYDMLSEILSNSGYHRTEYFLACVTAAKKKSFDSEYNKLVKSHKERRVTEKQILEEMSKARENKEETKE